jgi:MbtH protein
METGAAMLTNPFDDENGDFFVLINQEGQYSLWPSFKEIPSGWNAVGVRGTRQVCLMYVTEHWTDMRPKSVQAQVERDHALS